jgi:hypothetical protein
MRLRSPRPVLLSQRAISDALTTTTLRHDALLAQAG